MHVSRNGIHPEPAAAPAAPSAGHAPETRGLTSSQTFSPATLTDQDTTTLSPAANSASQLIAQALSGEPTQPAKVSQITAALANGSYQVDPGPLASALMVTMLNGAADSRAQA